MVTHIVHTARIVIGYIGNAISLFLFASPMPTFLRIYQNRSTEEFHPYPYIASSMNCLFWIFYGLPIVHPDSTPVISINAVGLALELIYLFIFVFFTHNEYRLHIIGLLVAEVAFLAIVAAPTLRFCHTHEMRSMVVGIVCVVFGVIMYASPLSIMARVIRTRSVEFMPFWVSVAAFFNGIIWTVYALLEFDLYILISNGLGAVAGLLQLILHAWCYNRPPADEGKITVQ